MSPHHLLATVLLDPPTALLFGCVVALISARLIAHDPLRELRRTAVIGAAWGLFYGLCVGWFFFRRADWMLVYLKDANEVSLVPAYLVFLALTAAHGAFGALANAALLRHGRRAAAWLVTLAALLTLAGAFWLQWRQYVLVGTWEQFQTGTAVPLQSDATMQAVMNVTGLLSAGAAVGLLAWRFLQARRVSATAASTTGEGPHS